MRTTGNTIYDFLMKLYPICRSITGNGVRETLQIINKEIAVNVKEVPSGTQVFDWQIPKEWNIRKAYVKDEKGKKIIDFDNNNLHVIGYSIPVDSIVSFEELNQHLYSLEDQPDAIPYVTSYYQPRWGFCISHNQRKELRSGQYKVFIDSELKDGALTYGELILPGKTEKEVFLSTYICHPSMANNELSGPSVVTFLAKWLEQFPRKYTYRIIFIPETIGSLTYMSKNLETMKQNVIAGFNITCVGDNRTYSFVPSRKGNTLADKVALHVLKYHYAEFKRYSYLDRGSDERQYCSPGADLPVVSIMRSKYREYPEYHTSLDNEKLVNPEGLYGAFNVLQKCLITIEMNKTYRVTCIGEPQLGKRGLFPTLSTKNRDSYVKTMIDLLAYADGTNDLVDIAERIGVNVEELYPMVQKLEEQGLLEEA